jgi:methylmalonyl-CoA/ethylmalonyl-CoA epimerase
MQFDHLGLVVKNLAKGRMHLAAIMHIRSWSEEFTDTINGVRCQFGRENSGFCYELLEPLDDNSPVKGALSERRAILNHVAYLVGELRVDAERLMEQGCAPTSVPKPAVAYGGRPIQFFVTPLNFIIELIEAPAHEHRFLQLFTD